MIFWTLWLKFQKDLCPLPCGEYTLRLIGIGEMPLLEPVILSVSASISARTSSKSTNFFPLQCKNSAYSTHSDRVTFTREMGRQRTKGTKRKGRTREKILNGWKQQIEDSVPSLRHCDREAICRAATKGDWDVAVYRTDILTCFIVDQLQNERSAGHNAWATWKEVPEWKRQREKNKKINTRYFVKVTQKT